MIKTKIRAALIHFVIGLFFITPILTYILLIWYPSPTLEASGLKPILIILIITDLIIGPILTFIVFKPFKKSLKLDLSIIAICQIIAFSYGLYTIYLGHPIYIVYAVDRFSIVTLKDFKDSNYETTKLPVKANFLGRPLLAYAKLPDKLEEKQKITFEVLSGKSDIDQRPEYYKSFDENSSYIINGGINLDKIKGNKTASLLLKKILSTKEISIDECSFFPIVGKEKDMIWIWNKLTKKPLDFIDIDPWHL